MISKSMRGQYPIPLLNWDSDAFTVGTSNTNCQYIASGQRYKFVIISSDPANTGNIWLNHGSQNAVVGRGICLAPGDVFWWHHYHQESFNAIATVAGQKLGTMAGQ